MAKFDAGEPGQVKARKTKAELRKEAEVEYLRSLLETYGGRATVWRWLEWCGVYKTSFTGNSETFFKEGMRNIGLKILEEVFEASPNIYGLMRAEAVEREKDFNK